ncbi:MAG: AAA family ATPase [Methanobacteriaceae archaeon]|nr:AAA family ATPase [Methanobacteriaceae archaeon]
MNPKNTGGALGKGLDALIKRDESTVTEKVDEKTVSEKKASERSKPSAANTKKRADSDDHTVQAVLMEVHKNPRISLWSARSAAVLRFLKKTKPEFSISKEASALIEAAVEDKYPDIWKLFQDQDF